MSYSERGFPFADNPSPDHCWHVAAWEEHNRLNRVRRMPVAYRQRVPVMAERSVA